MDTFSLFSRIKNLPLASAKLVEGLLSGNYRSVFRGPGLEFDEVREYHEGDDSRFIDWNVSSRLGVPYMKTFREEREMILFMLIDVSASLQTGTGRMSKQDMTAVVSSLLSFSAVHNNDRVGAVFFSDKIEKWVPPRKGKKQVFRLVEDMMHLPPEGQGSDLAHAIRTVYESLNRRGICVIVSDFRVNPSWREMSLLSKKHDVIAVKITDPSEKVFPFTGMVQLIDPETGARMKAPGASRKFRHSYREFWDAYHLLWQRECRRRGVDTLSISTNDDPVVKLMQFFQSRRKRR
ncbi:MAG TPA: DUF58 domain-containing protein [Clostridia bacterium]|nr:DUF58 domain-containing protein [Clostridia bacterium]